VGIPLAAAAVPPTTMQATEVMLILGSASRQKPRQTLSSPAVSVPVLALDPLHTPGMGTIVPARSSDRWPRLVDVVLSLLLLIVAAPLLVVLALAIRWFDGAPVLFAQQRLGRGGVPFRLHKLRTLVRAAGPTVSPEADPRTTRLGGWLRRLHVDELPQLFDVLRGRMALVGPRPEVPANLAAVPAADLERLWAVRPGITGPTQLAFLAEDELLAAMPDPVATYREVLVPAKVAMDLDWSRRRTLVTDLWLLFATPWRVCSGRSRQRSRDRLRALLRSEGGAR